MHIIDNSKYGPMAAEGADPHQGHEPWKKKIKHADQTLYVQDNTVSSRPHMISHALLHQMIIHCIGPHIWSVLGAYHSVLRLSEHRGKRIQTHRTHYVAG